MTIISTRVENILYNSVNCCLCLDSYSNINKSYLISTYLRYLKLYLPTIITDDLLPFLPVLYIQVVEGKLLESAAMALQNENQTI